MKTLIVLAGNHREFEIYRQRQFRPNTMLVYGNSEEKLLGITADAIDEIGTFAERSDADAIRYRANMCLR